MKYSIIVATYNRLEEIIELLNSSSKLNFPVELFEFVFVDDGSTDNTASFIQDLGKNSEFNIQYYFQQNKGPGAARNLGMQKAKGDYFIFVDSDCILPPDWLSKIDRDLLKYDYDAFGGPDTCRDDFPVLLKAINYSMTSF